MCIEVCKRRFIPYVVAPVEADSQVCRHDKLATAVCRDSDELAYELPKVVIVDSYFKEMYRYFDMTLPVTDEIKKKYPLYHYRHRYGVKIFHWWAAVMGCDITKEKSGMLHAGRKAFLSALASFDDKPSPTAATFAKALRSHCGLLVKVRYSSATMQKELERVSDWFLHLYKN